MTNLRKAQKLLFSGITVSDMSQVEQALDQGARWDLTGDLGAADYSPHMYSAVWRHNAAQYAFNRMLAHGDSSVVERLIKAGADFTPVIKQMVEPARLASRMAPKSKPQGLVFVLDHWPEHLGKWDEWKDPGTGKTLLHMLSQNPIQSIQISVLLDKGMDVNVRDQHGNTPLHLSVSGVSTTTLIHGGADIIALNDAGKTAQRIFLDRLAVETRKSGANNNAINTCWLNFYCLAIHDSIIKDPKPAVILRRLDKILTPELKQKLETNSIMEPVYEQMDYLRAQEKSKKLTKVADKVRSKVRFQKQLSQTAVPGNASEAKKPKM